MKLLTLFYKEKREIEKKSYANDCRDRFEQVFGFMRRIRLWVWTLIFLGGISFFIILSPSVSRVMLLNIGLKSAPSTTISHPAGLLEVMRLRGCVADGILSGYGGDTRASVDLINRSECLYLHRALESWLNPPDFELARRIMPTIKKPKIVYGMFISEALNTKAEYYASTESRVLDFSKMCQSGSVGFWGKDTCKASFDRDEYRIYVRDITQKAMDMGIQSFLFGQIHFQDQGRDVASEIQNEMHDYAKSKGIHIAIGAQTNTITDAKYLGQFDYIEGGLGILTDGSVDDAPCASRYEKQGWCWALLWHKRYLSGANMVLVHLDWSGISGDDMSVFAGMSREKRAETLQNLVEKFNTKKGKTGFLYPFLATLYDGNEGCYGANKDFYSPDNRYSCRDEDTLNALLRMSEIPGEDLNEVVSFPVSTTPSTSFIKGNEEIDDAKFDEQDVPDEMVAGREYTVSVTMKNIGTTTWTVAGGYRLGSQNPQDTPIFGGRVFLPRDRHVLPGKKQVFTFMVKAPEKTGEYNFQWKMIREGQGWFGNPSKNNRITVVSPEASMK